MTVSETEAPELISSDLTPFLGKLISVHVVDGPKHIKNTDDVFVGVLEAFHIVTMESRRSEAGTVSLKVGPYSVRATRYQLVTIKRIL